MISPYKPISLPSPYPYQKFPIPPFLKISIPLLKMVVQTMFSNYSRKSQAKLCHQKVFLEISQNSQETTVPESLF